MTNEGGVTVDESVPADRPEGEDAGKPTFPGFRQGSDDGPMPEAADAATEPDVLPEVDADPAEVDPDVAEDAEDAVADAGSTDDGSVEDTSETVPDALEEDPEMSDVVEADSADVVEAEPTDGTAPAPEAIVQQADAVQAAETPDKTKVAVDEAPTAEEAAAAAEEDEAETRRRSPFRGPGEWYVVHTYAGYENKVKTNLESRIHTMQMEEKIFNVHIPMEDVMEIKGGKKQVVQRKVFPGYLLVKMVYDNDSWYVVRNTPGVTGFVSAGTGTKPTPLSKREVEKILAVKKEEVKPQFRLEFEEGDVVRIISGPFADFNGTISEINLDQSKLKVLVNIFDRETPVELGFDQVQKV
jgi:transcriptional antiterminator NusG